MSTSGVVDGRIIKLKLGGTVVAYLTSNDENLQNDLRETTNKDTGGKATFLGGKSSSTYSAEFFHVEGAANGYSVLRAAGDAGTILPAEISSDVVGDKNYTCSLLIRSLKRSAPDNQNTVVSVEFQVTGAVTEGTES